MTDEAVSTEGRARAHDPKRAIDEWSMRFLELALAGIALLAALLLTVR